MKSKKAALWIRVSSIMQVDSGSHEHHEIRAKKFAKERGHTVVKIYRLKAMSGKSIMGYAQTKEMLADIRNGVIDTLIFSKVPRLARNTKELIEIAEIFQECNAHLLSMDMTIQTDTSIGRHFFRQMASMAEFEREMIAERISASVITRAELGKHLGGQPPFGFKYVEKRLEVNIDESPVLKLMYDLFLEHGRYKTIARILNDKGYRTRKGNQFTDSTVKRLLINPVSYGLQRMNYSKSTARGTKILKPKKDWVYHKLKEGVVSKELWDKVNSIISKRTRNKTKVSNTLVHLFTGFMFCACDSEKSRMYTRKDNDNYVCHSCKNKIHKEDLEEIYKNELYTYTISENEITKYYDGIKKVAKDKQKQLEKLKKEKIQLQSQIENLLLLHTQGQIKTEAFHSYHAKPYNRLIQIGESIAELELEVSVLSTDKGGAEKIIEEAKNLYEKWDTLSHQQKRNIIEIITEKIIVGKTDITINLYNIIPDNVMTSSLESTTNGQHNLNGMMW